MHEALLDFKLLEDQHTEKRLVREIFNILDTYNIMIKLFYITIDNVFNNNKAMKKLFKLL